jgi:predicted lipid-binding transport protein (Tim44 family)
MLAALMTHPAVLALAGRGSSGFSGGRSSGGGFSSNRTGGGGGIFFIGGGGGGGGGLLILIILVVVALVVLPRLFRAWNSGAAATKRRATAKQRAQRESEVLPQAMDAAGDDAAFDPDDVRAAAAGLVLDTQDAWDEGDRARLARLVGPDLLREWTRRLDDFDRRGWRSHSRVTSTPDVRIVGLDNQADDADDRVVVHVEAQAQSWVETRSGQMLFEDGARDENIVLSQYWTLGKRDGRWILISIEEDGEGDHNLMAPIVARPDMDPALADQSRVEMAVADRSTDLGTLTELIPASLSDDARASALDLSLVDDRFSPDVLTVGVRRAVSAWTRAIDGSDDALNALATPDAVRRLLYADRGADVRTVVRGPRIDDVVIERVIGETAPPRIEVAIRYHARWYREDRDTQAVLEGSRTAEQAREERWTFALTDDADVPWQLVGA